MNVAVRHPRYIGGVAIPPAARDLAPAVLQHAGSIVGRITDAATGRPVAGVTVGAQLVEYRRRAFGGGWAETVSDEQGRFGLGGMEPGVYNVLLHGVPDRPEVTARAVECVRVRAGADATADLAVIEGRPLRVEAIDRDTGRLVPRTLIGCYGPARPRSGAAVESHRADDQGRITFHVPPGEQYVYLMEGGFGSRQAHRTVAVPERGEVEPVRLLMQVASPPRTGAMKDKDQLFVAKEAIRRDEPVAAVPAGAGVAAEAPDVRIVTGHVRDPQGRPLAGIHFGGYETGNRGHPVVMPERIIPATDREGLFVFPNLPRRPIRIELRRAGYRDQVRDLPADRNEVEWTVEFVPEPRTRNEEPPRDDPIPAGLRDRLTFVDLDPRGTEYLVEGPEDRHDLSRLRAACSGWATSFFRVGDRMIRVGRGEAPCPFPRAVKEIPIRARGRVLRFLHATTGGQAHGALVGSYVVRYADGSTRTIPLAYGRDIDDWFALRNFGAPSRAAIAWSGGDELTDIRPDHEIRLFELDWTNPDPDKEIASLDMLSAGKDDCDPFLVAITLERDR